jgi:hypothetical protein
MSTRTRVAVCLICVGLIAVIAQELRIDGAVAGTTLRELVERSDVIARGRVVKCVQDEDGSGSAWLRCDLVYKGSLGRDTVQIDWVHGPEAMRLPCVGSVYLLFLKSVEEGRLEPTHPMASYWPLKTVFRSSREVVPYVFPVTMVDVGKPGLMRQVPVGIEGLPRESNPIEVRSIPLDLLVPQIRTILGTGDPQ